MDNSFGQVVNSAKSLLILLPTKPYLDQVAAGLALFLATRDKKEVQISCPSPMTVEFNRLVGVNRITQELGSKNLTLKFPDYPADNIERVSYDIEDGQFRLTVIPKPGTVSPKKEQVELTYSGVAADLAILVGGATENHFPALSDNQLLGVDLAHIGTKELVAPKEKQIMSFARPATSTSEVMTALINGSGMELDPDIATNLLTGIEDGSGGFSSSETTAATFETAALLMKKGGKRRGKEKKESFVPGSIPGESPLKSAGSDAPKGWSGPKVYKGDNIS